MSLEDLMTNLYLQNPLRHSPAYFKNHVQARMTEIMRLMFIQGKTNLDAKFGCFEILSFDFILDANDLTPYLLDINSNPSFSLEMEGNRKVIRTLLRDVTTMTSDLHEPGVKKAHKAYLERVFACQQQDYDIVYSQDNF